MTDKTRNYDSDNGGSRCLNTMVRAVNRCIKRNPHKNTDGLWIDLRVSEALTIIVDFKEYEELFRIQKTRLDAATKYWQTMTGQKDTFPDLGELLDFMLNRITSLETTLGRRVSNDN